jgi:formate dehydrogenase major subunit
MQHAIERDEITCLYIIGENPVQSDADQHHVESLFDKLDFLVVQDITMTRTAALADVVLPCTASWAESEGTVTNSERRVQRVRKAVAPPGEARDDCWIVQDIANRMRTLGVGPDIWHFTSHEQIWNELRGLSPMHAGMSYARLEANHGLQWPCYDEQHPGEKFMHARLWARPLVGPRVPFLPAEHDPVVEPPDDAYPLLLTTGRRLEFYNTGAQTRFYPSARRQEEYVLINPTDAVSFGIAEGDLLRVSSRRGMVEARAKVDDGLYEGLVFMTLHFPDQVATNYLTINATDPKSGTAEFKATAVKLEVVAYGDTFTTETQRHRGGTEKDEALA